MITKTPSKGDFDISQKYGITNILIDKKTRITRINGQVTFNRIDSQNTTLDLSTITLRHARSADQYKTVRHLTGVKVINTLNGESLKKARSSPC